jgi:hypothetical protein
LLDLLPVVEAERDNLLAMFRELVACGDYAAATAALEASYPLAGIPSLRSTAERWAGVVAAADSALTRRQQAVWRQIRGDALLCNGRIAEGLSDTMVAADLAEGAGDQQLAARCRSIGLLWVGFGGYPVVDDVVALAPLAGDSDEPFWGHAAWLAAQWIGAYQGRVREADRVHDAMPPIPDRASVTVTGQYETARGIAAYYAGRPAETIERLLPLAGLAYFNDAGSSVFLVMAAVDVGRDLRGVAERALRPAFRDEGNPIAGASLAAFRTMHAIVDDDLVTASASLRDAVAAYERMQLPGAWHHDRYTLVAAGVLGPEHATFEAGGVVVAVSSSVRARAEVALRDGRLPDALELGHEALANDLDSGAQRSQLFTLEFLARVLAASGRGQEAARLFGACEAFRADSGMIRVPCLQRLLDASGASTDAAAVEEGRSLTLDMAADYARRFRATQVTATSGWDALTPTERKVADLVAEGLSNPAVAKQLLMSPATVKPTCHACSPNSTSRTAKTSSSPPPAADPNTTSAWNPLVRVQKTLIHPLGAVAVKRPVILRDELPPDDAIVVVRGGTMNSEFVRSSATDAFDDFGFFGISVSLALDDAVVELLHVGDTIVVGNEDADAGVAEVVELGDRGFVLLRVFPGSVEDNRHRLGLGLTAGD